MSRSVAEDVFFIAVCGENTGWPVAADGLPRVPSGLDAAVAGALLLDLALGRWIEWQADPVIVTNIPPPSDADLLGVLQQISSGEHRRSVRWWIERLAAGRPHLRALAKLRARGLVSEYDQPRRGFFGKYNERRCFAPDWGAEELVMRRLQAELDGNLTDDRTKGLLALLCAGGRELHGWVTGARPDAASLATQIAERHWIGREVAHVVYTQSIYVPT